MIYSIDINTPSYMCDDYDHLHPWAAVRLCQEVTEYHGNNTGIGFKEISAEGHAWVITRAYYQFYRRPDAFEPIKLTTWSRGNDGLIAFRDYRVITEKGEPILDGTSYWPMINLATRRVIRLSKLFNNYEYHDINATEKTSIEKIKNPENMSVEPIMELVARHTMIDHTLHVNNSEYVKWVFDALHSKGINVESPFTLTVNYSVETRQEEKVSIFCTEIEGGYHFLIRNPRGICFTALLKKQ